MTDAPTTPSPERQPADAGGEMSLNTAVSQLSGLLLVLDDEVIADRDLIEGYERCDYADALRVVLDALSAPQAQPDARAVEGLIRDCAKQFRFYEKSHAAKGTPDGDAKAIVNAQFAQRCEDALSAPAADDGWRDISTAPKDGTQIILWCIKPAVQDYDTKGPPLAVIGNWSDGIWNVPFSDDWIEDSGFTHWRNLPAPPTVEDGL